MATTSPREMRSPTDALREAGQAWITVLPHPFPYDETGKLRAELRAIGAHRIAKRVPGSGTIQEALEGIGLGSLPVSYLGWLVIHNGVPLTPGEMRTRTLAPGDRVLCQAMPRDPVSITAFLGTVGAGILEGIGAAVVGTFGTTITSTLAAGGFYTAFGQALGGVLTYGGGAFLAQIATRALVGSPDSGGKAQGSTTSPRSAGLGNQLLVGNPLPLPMGQNVRVTPPYLAMPFQPGYSGGDNQDPSLRALMGTAGTYTPTSIKMGQTDLQLLDAESTSFSGVQTVNFPTVLRKTPGLLLRDEYGGSREEIVSTDEVVDELSMIWHMASGLYRIDEDGDQEIWQIAHETQYRAVGSGTWLDFYARDQAGNYGQYRVPFVQAIRRSNRRLLLTGRTTESFYWYQRRKVARDKYELKFQLVNEPLVIRKKKKILIAHWPRDRGVGGTGNTDTLSLGTDPVLVQLLGYRNEPAVENCPSKISGLDITVHANTAKSDESNRISYLASPEVPGLSGGSRTAAAATANPVAHVLNWLTNSEIAGDKAIADARINWASWQDAYDECDLLVPTIGGGTEPKHQIYGVLDRPNVGRLDLAQDILSSFRMRLATSGGQYHIIVDKKRDSFVFPFTDADILEWESERIWAVEPDELRCTFFNAEEMGEQDELRSYNSSPPVAGKLEHGGYAAKTAALGDLGGAGGVATNTTRSGDYALIQLTGAETWASFPEEGWCCVRWESGVPFADARLFLIDELSADLKTLTLIDVDGDITVGARNGQFNTTAAQRIEALSLPYTGRPSEVWREAQYRHMQKLRPEVHKIHVGLEGLAVARGDMGHFQTSVTSFGLGSALLLAVEGALATADGIKVDEEFDLSGLSSPAVRIRSHDGSNVLFTRLDIDDTATTTLRASKGGDARWLGFATPQNLTGLGLAFGDSSDPANGSAVAFGERLFESRELIIQEIYPGENATFTLHCIDHAPEMFDDILEAKPVPRYQSGVVDRLAGGARPAVPAFAATDDSVTSGLASITITRTATVSEYTRAAGSYLDDGFTTTHKVSAIGYETDADNNVTRQPQDAAPTATVIEVDNTDGSAEAGTGNEAIVGIIGSVAQTLEVDRHATGYAQLDVNPQGGGVVWLDDAATSAAFAAFRGTGFVHLSGMADGTNDGWWTISSKPNDNRLILSDPANSMVSTAGTGYERAQQSQLYGAAADFTADGLAVNDRVRVDGFAESYEGVAFTARGVGTTTLAVEDPFGRLVTETGDGDETITRLVVPVSYELAESTEGALTMWVNVPIRPQSATLVSSEEIEARWRVRDPDSGVVTGWTTGQVVASSSTSVRIGPIPAESDFDVALRAISRDGIPSLYNVLTGDHGAGRPPAAPLLQIHSDSVATAEGNRFALRAEWAAPDFTGEAVYSYLLRYRRQGASQWQSLLAYDTRSAVILGAQIGTYLFELYTLGTNGQPSTAIYATFDWDPDRDFEDVGVLNLRLVNHA